MGERERPELGTYLSRFPSPPCSPKVCPKIKYMHIYTHICLSIYIHAYTYTYTYIYERSSESSKLRGRQLPGTHYRLLSCKQQHPAETGNPLHRGRFSEKGLDHISPHRDLGLGALLPPSNLLGCLSPTSLSSTNVFYLCV